MRREFIAFVLLLCSDVCHAGDAESDVKVILEDVSFSKVSDQDVSGTWYDLSLALSVTNTSDRTIDIEVGQIVSMAKSIAFFALPDGDQVHMQGELIVTKYNNRVAVSLGAGKDSTIAYSYRCKADRPLAKSTMKYDVDYESWGITNGTWFLRWRASGGGSVAFRHCDKQNNESLTEEALR